MLKIIFTLVGDGLEQVVAANPNSEIRAVENYWVAHHVVRFVPQKKTSLLFTMSVQSLVKFVLEAIVTWQTVRNL